MAGPSLPPGSHTPVPDPLDPSSEDSKDESRGSHARPSSSSDDLNILLDATDPDPYLRTGPTGQTATSADHVPGNAARETGVSRGRRPAPKPKGVAKAEGQGAGSSPKGPFPSSSEHELDLPIRLTSQDIPVSVLDSPGGESSRSSDSHDDHGHQLSWPLLLVGSYASALTLALAWVLWTGRTLSRSTDRMDREELNSGRVAVSKNAPSKASISVPLPANRLTTLDRTIRVGELEVTPRRIDLRPVELVRLDGETGDRREADPALYLTLEIKNISDSYAFTPLDASLVRDSTPGTDQAFLELAEGQRIPLFPLATESEWSIVGQDFPTLQPGESAEMPLVTIPVSLDQLSSSMTWHVKLRTGPFQTEIFGVRFSASDVRDEWR